ncbi:acetyltransferase [Yoonia litorea]|uniref:Putative colanic acid biosynthesis acetyltransferase WcaF n=1 Tax=Yoonia litorea TaxID=1123755 RepID=A0A1I6LDY9_9RHOB|nr:acetyltransferase [Yoonia litorea]SFS01636.1 putative colanic acid biosynthesis acetyltransferase WcaF [Yoonia litorea]
MTARLDIKANRTLRKWSHRVQVGRVLWALATPLFRFSPRPCWGWRRGLLRCFGAQVGLGVQIHPSVRITMPWNLEIGPEAGIGDRVILYALGRINIGPRTTISQHAHLCAGSHDLALASRPLVKSPITIGADAWVCADAFVGPGVRIGDQAVLGARAVAMKDVPAAHLGVGNPIQLRRLQ